MRPQAAVERRRSALLATTALAILAAAMASPRSALAQSCSTSGTDPVTVTCNAPGATITTVGGTGNTTSPNPATNASTQQFNADLIGNVTATTTVLGFGLNLVTVKANGGIAMTNNGQVTRFQLGSPALFLNGNGGAVTYNGAGFISSTGDALRLGNRSNGAISATIDGSATASGPNAAAVSAQNLGSGTVLVTGGGSVLGTSAGISATSNSGNVTVSGSGDSIASGPNGDGIAISSTSGNVLVNRTGTASGAFGINALAGGNGNITITGIGEAIGTGAVFGVAGTGIATSAAAGTTTIATTHNVTGGLVGIGAFASSGGTINVTTGGTVTGGFAAVVLNSSANNTLVNSGAIVNSSGLAGLAIEAFAGNNAVTNSGLVAGAVDLGPGANAFNNLAGGAFLAGSSVKLGAGNTLSNAGTFSPGGPSVMTTALTGNYVQSATGIYAFTVSPTAASRTNISGTANIAGAAQALALPGTYTPGQTYTILTAAGGLSGTFGALSVSGSFGAVHPTLTYDANDVFLLLQPALAASLSPGASGNQRAVASAIDAGFAAGNSSPAFLPLFNLTPGSLGTALTQLSGEIATGASTATFQAGAQFLSLMVDPFVDAWSDAGVTGRPLGFAPEAAALPASASAFAHVPTKAPLLTKAPPRVEQRFTAWAAGYGGQGRLDGDPVTGSHDLTASSAGIAAGLDYRLAPNAVIGVAAAGGSLSFGLAEGLGSGRGDGAQGGVFGKARFGDAYVAAAAALARHDLSTDRTVTGVPGFFDHLTADFTATSYGGRIETGRRFATLPNFGVTPYAAFQAQSFTTPDYLEHDALGLAGFALAVRGRTTTDDRTELGAWLDSRWRISESASLTLRDRAAWVHDFSHDRSVTALFQTLPTAAFTVLGATPAPDAALLSARADLTFRNDVSWFARFDGELAQSTHAYSGTGGVKVAW